MRTPGYYWIMLEADGSPRIAEWKYDKWWIIGWDIPIDPSEVVVTAAVDVPEEKAEGLARIVTHSSILTHLAGAAPPEKDKAN